MKSIVYDWDAALLGHSPTSFGLHWSYAAERCPLRLFGTVVNGFPV